MHIANSLQCPSLTGSKSVLLWRRDCKSNRDNFFFVFWTKVLWSRIGSCGQNRDNITIRSITRVLTKPGNHYESTWLKTFKYLKSFSKFKASHVFSLSFSLTRLYRSIQESLHRESWAAFLLKWLRLGACGSENPSDAKMGELTISYTQQSFP